MKAIIDGKRYDTETATEVAGWSNRLGYNDFNHIEESLYITEKGNWFLSGGGGPKTKYAQPAPGGGMTGSKKIIPLKNYEAMEWLEEKNETEAIEKYFPESIEDA